MGGLNPELAKQNIGQTNAEMTNYQSSAITEEEVHSALKAWGDGLVAISKAYAENQQYREVAVGVLKNSYAFHKGDVLFKPTLASQVMFRTTFDSALSYFIGNDHNYPEDKGFAIKSWAYVDFEIIGIKTGRDHALTMGNKILIDKNGGTTIANFSMAFIRDDDGSLKINLHHSSLPYKA